MKSILALAILFLAQAAAKFGFGACPSLNFMTFAQYQAAYPATGPTAVYSHKLMYGDATFQQLLDFAKAFI